MNDIIAIKIYFYKLNYRLPRLTNILKWRNVYLWKIYITHKKKGCTCFVFLFCFFRLAYPFGRPQNEMGKTTVRPLYSPFPLRTESARRIAASSAQPPRASSAAHAAANEFALSSGSRCHCRALRRCFTGCTETISGDDVASWSDIRYITYGSAALANKRIVTLPTE